MRIHYLFDQSACHEACSGCTGPTPKECIECKGGYEKSAAGECVDIDECLSEDLCAADEVCVNMPGAHKCSSKLKYMIFYNWFICYVML